MKKDFSLVIMLLSLGLFVYTINKTKLPNLILQFIIIGAILFVLAMVILHSKDFSKNFHGGMIILGILLLIAGFVLIFTIIPGKLISNEDYSLFQGFKLCNSYVEDLAYIFESGESFLKECQMINMLFFLGVLLGAIGIILLIVGLVKKK